MKKETTISAIIALFVMLAVLPQSSSAREGFYMGTGLGMDAPVFQDHLDDFEPETGLCLEFVHLGYNFSDRWGVGFQWGRAAGKADFSGLIGDDDAFWGQQYVTMTGRYTHELRESWDLYAELGLGHYTFVGESRLGEIRSDPAVGGKIALGASYHLGKFYLGPELGFHYASFDKAHVDMLGDDQKIEELGDAGMAFLLLKAGYFWSR